jgi:hypothetical protein
MEKKETKKSLEVPYLFSNSSRDHGTLKYFCSLLCQLPKAKVPKKDFNACIDILFTILKCHYITPACSVLGITPSLPMNPTYIWRHERHRMKKKEMKKRTKSCKTWRG